MQAAKNLQTPTPGAF